MKAKILPLKGKYYGTEIVVKFEPNELGERAWSYETTFKLWLSDGEPSVRELESWNITQEQWDNNELVDSEWDGKIHVRDMDILCDSHYESKATYRLAKLIVNAVNNAEE